MSVTDATCPSCRRTVEPEKGPVGAVCPRCGGFLPTVAREPATAPPPALSPPAPVEEGLGPVTERVANRVLAEFAPRVQSVRELADLHDRASEEIALAYQADIDHLQAEALERERSQTWRQALPGLAAALVGVR